MDLSFELSSKRFHHLDLANTGLRLDGRSGSLVGGSGCNIAKVRQEARVASTSEIARIGKSVDSASAADVLLADSGGRGVIDSEQAAAGGSVLDGSLDTGESVALGEDLGSRRDLEGVAGVVLPVVVDGVKQGVAGDFRGTAGRAVDVVALEGDLVLRAGEVQCPVLVAVAGGGPVRGAVDFAVGDGDAAGGVLAEDDVLTADLGGLGVAC